MKYVCAITRSGKQARITLPKKFLESRGFEKHNFIIIDDRPDELAVIRGASFEDNDDRKRKTGSARADR